MEETLQLIVLANDPLARAGLASLLASLPGCAVAAQGSNHLLFEAAAGEIDIRADLIVWDMGWGPEEGQSEDRFHQSVPVLALVADEEAAGAAWRLGSRGVLLRDMDEERLAAAVVAVAAGLVVFSPPFFTSLSLDRTTDGAVDLTRREFEVLTLLAEGLTNKAIAHQLLISDHTVKFHVNAILNKLDAQSRTDAVVRATRLGLIAL